MTTDSLAGELRNLADRLRAVSRETTFASKRQSYVTRSDESEDPRFDAGHRCKGRDVHANYNRKSKRGIGHSLGASELHLIAAEMLKVLDEAVHG